MPADDMYERGAMADEPGPFTSPDGRPPDTETIRRISTGLARANAARVADGDGPLRPETMRRIAAGMAKLNASHPGITTVTFDPTDRTERPGAGDTILVEGQVEDIIRRSLDAKAKDLSRISEGLTR